MRTLVCIGEIMIKIVSLMVKIYNLYQHALRNIFLIFEMNRS